MESAGPTKPDRRRGGAVIVEFALLLPFFVFFVFFVLLFMEMMFRAVWVSHASFAAARRTAVQAFGGTPATEYVRWHYAIGGMRGVPVVGASSSMGSNPRIKSVRVTDQYTALLPTGRRSGIYPELRETTLSVSHAPVNIAGTGSRSLNTDNDL